MNLLVAALFLTQEKTAEETFSQIEKKILEARTISAKFQYVWGNRERDTEDESGFLLVKAGNKALYFESSLLSEDPMWICDGKRVQSIRPESDDERSIAPDGRRPKRISAPAQLESQLRIRMSRAAIVIDRFLYARGEHKGVGPAQEEFLVSGFKYGEKDGKARSLRYRLSVGKEASALEVTLWYDPDSLAVRKKTITGAASREKPITLTETYTEFALNTDLPDEKFRLPSTDEGSRDR